MADLTITSTSVIPPASARQFFGTCGEALTTGMIAYKNTSDNLWYKADCTTALKAGSSVATNIAVVMAGGAINQSVALLEVGQIYTAGATVVVGTVYVISATAGGGKIAPVADLATTNFVTYLGYGVSTTQILFQPNPTGLQRA
jgi:hypothetical protein